jgi:preprotein translocase subunit SecY
MLQAVINAFKIPDLRNKILFTLGILIVFRFVAHIPVPGVDQVALRNLFENNALLGMLNLFSGSALENFSVAAMGVYPYITASIIMQLLTPIIPRLTEWQKEGEYGRTKLNQWTHWLTVPLALLQGFGQSVLMQREGALPNFDLTRTETLLPSLTVLISLVAGTIVCVWLGELITENGIGNGVSIIIFGGIVAGLPDSISRLFAGGNTLQNIAGLAAFITIGLITIVGIVLVNEGQRRVPVHYAKRIRGNRMYGGTSTHIPLRVNSAGMIPLIFAVSILVFPGTIATWLAAAEAPWLRDAANFLQRVFDPNTVWYQVLYFLMVVFFSYFYTLVVFQQQNIAESLQKNGGFIPGVRPGRPTASYLLKVLNRITLIGAGFLGLVAVLPFLAGQLTGVTTLLLESTALLIVVGVAIDTMRQLEAQLLMRHYEGFIK